MTRTTPSIVTGAAVVGVLCLAVGAQGCRSSMRGTRQTRTDAVLIEIAEAGAVIDLWRDAAERTAPGDRSLMSMSEEVFHIQSSRLQLLRDRARVMYGGTDRETDRFLAASESDRAALKAKVEGLRQVLLARIAPESAAPRD